MALGKSTRSGMAGVMVGLSTLLALVACGGTSEHGPSPAGRTPSSSETAGKEGTAVGEEPGGNDVGSAGAVGAVPAVSEGGTGSGGTSTTSGSSGGIGGNGRLPSFGPYDSVGVSVPPEDCHFGGAGTCCTYNFCLDVEDTIKVFNGSSAGGAGGAPPDIADVCHAVDTRVGFCGEITTLPSVKDGKCCFAVNSGDCC